MLYTTLLVFNSFITSPHHMGMGMGIGMGLSDDNISTATITPTSYNQLYNETNNETLVNNSDPTNFTDFSLPIGIGASLGIIGLIITLISIERNKTKNSLNTDREEFEGEASRDIYIEPVSHDIITNTAYELPSINIDNEYETITDTLYELARN
tara:strand:+ start:429 stop:890 length:462 start_codon:yes stop_codon:yes gene_type:complete